MPKPTLTILAAVASNGVIGKDNRLPWHLPEDLGRFKALTTGHAVIMGRKTWESLPAKFRPLPQRLNIVVTRDPAFSAPGALVTHSLLEAIAAAGGAEAFVIGGAEIFIDVLPLADRLELTELDGAYEGDVFFPDFDRSAWRESARVHDRLTTGIAYAFVTYERSKA